MQICINLMNIYYQLVFGRYNNIIEEMDKYLSKDVKERIEKSKLLQYNISVMIKDLPQVEGKTQGVKINNTGKNISY